MTFTLNDAHAIAMGAHESQFDKIEVPYIHHVEAVADGVADFDLEIQVAAMLHDVVEDSDITIDDLRTAGVSERSLAAITMVSSNLHADLSDEEAIANICTSRDATLVKVSDNAHNSLPERVAALSRDPHPKYALARKALYAAIPREDVERILRRANPALLDDLPG